MVLSFLFGKSSTEVESVLTPGERTGVALGLILMVIAGPIVETVQPYLVNLLVEVLIFMMLALSLDFIFGYGGLPSFAHAAMFGVGGYVAAFLLTGPMQNLLVILLAAFVFGGIVALLIGSLSVRSTGLYFAFITLAFTEMIYVIIYKDLPADLFATYDAITQGSNGIVGIMRPDLAFIDLSGSLTYYYLVAVVLIGMTALTIRIANSPFGTVVRGVRENEERMSALGYNTTRYKVVAFVISGGFASIAGALYVPFQSIVTPGLLNWTVTGELIGMTLIGGLGTLWGPMFAAGGITILEHYLTRLPGWPILLGMMYIIVIIYAPNGLAGLIKSFKQSGVIAQVNGLIERVVEGLRTLRQKY